MTRVLAILALVLLAAAPARAQTVEAQRFRLSVGPCVLSSGAGAPSAGVTCDTYFDNASGDFWMKQAGTWRRIPGSGTPGTLSRWNTSTTLQDSAISESGGVATVNESIGGPSYASQVSGWRITAAGAADVRYLFTNELRANIFTADAESVLAGAQRVTKSYSTISQAFTCPAAGATATLWVADSATYGDAAVFQANDWIVIHALSRVALGPFTIADCVGTVTGYTDGSGTTAGQQSWTFTRGSGANAGAMSGGAVVAVNQLAQDLGVSGNGYVETTALDGANNGNAPYMQVVTWTGAPTSANLTARCRYGNVTGITGLTNEYGLMCGDVTGPGHYLRLSNLVAELRDIPVNLLDASSTKVLSLDPSGPYFAMGNPLPTSYAGSNSGIWMGNDAGTYKVRIGGAAGNRLQWDGTTLSISGNGSGVTSINGGNIQTGTVTATQIAASTITGDKIAANTITVGNLIATGMGDNLIKNGTFEGANAAQALAGWLTEYSPAIATSCCGTNGPGTMYVNSGGSPWNAGVYQAVPMLTGAVAQPSVFRVAFDVFLTNAVGSGLFFTMNESTATGTNYVDHVFYQTVAPYGGANVVADSHTYFLNSGGQAAGWHHYEFTYSPPAATRWVSICFLNSSASSFHVDNVEMRLQLGGASIQAASITATQIAAGTITSGQIAAGTITGGNIAGGTITAGNIAASTITSGQIAASTITGGNIAGGTITGGNIAATTITAGNLNVTSLSAITANLGSVTAGSLSAVTVTGSTISGTTITAGCATMNSNGISLTAGGAACNWYKFNGASVGLQYDGGSWMTLGGAQLSINSSGGALVQVDNNVTLQASGGGYFRAFASQLQFSPWTGAPSGGKYFLCVDGNGYLVRGLANGTAVCN
jgi:hypothetical protein